MLASAEVTLGTVGSCLLLGLSFWSGSIVYIGTRSRLVLLLNTGLALVYVAVSVPQFPLVVGMLGLLLVGVAFLT